MAECNVQPIPGLKLICRLVKTKVFSPRIMDAFT